MQVYGSEMLRWGKSAGGIGGFTSASVAIVLRLSMLLSQSRTKVSRSGVEVSILANIFLPSPSSSSSSSGYCRTRTSAAMERLRNSGSSGSGLIRRIQYTPRRRWTTYREFAQGSTTQCRGRLCLSRTPSLIYRTSSRIIGSPNTGGSRGFLKD